MFKGIFFSIVFASVFSAHAAELRVHDQLGLVRAVKDISGNATVEVVVPEKTSSSVSVFLFSVDGLGERKRAHRKANIFRFENIPAGSWEIISGVKTLTIDQVRILKE